MNVNIELEYSWNWRIFIVFEMSQYCIASSSSESCQLEYSRLLQIRILLNWACSVLTECGRRPGQRDQALTNAHSIPLNSRPLQLHGWDIAVRFVDVMMANGLLECEYWIFKFVHGILLLEINIYHRNERHSAFCLKVNSLPSNRGLSKNAYY